MTYQRDEDELTPEEEEQLDQEIARCEEIEDILDNVRANIKGLDRVDQDMEFYKDLYKSNPRLQMIISNLSNFLDTDVNKRLFLKYFGEFYLKFGHSLASSLSNYAEFLAVDLNESRTHRQKLYTKNRLYKQAFYDMKNQRRLDMLKEAAGGKQNRWIRDTTAYRQMVANQKYKIRKQSIGYTED